MGNGWPKNTFSFLWKTSLIWMTLKSISPECLLNDFPVWLETALFLDAEDGAHFSKLPLIEDDVLLRI